MPRAPGSGKRHSGASAGHSNRHDNGLVGPAKRVTPRKSQTYLDPTGPSRPASDQAAGQGGSSSVPPLPADAARTAAQYDLSSSHENRSNDAGRRPSVGGYSETSSDSGNLAIVGGHGGGMGGSHRSIDVNAAKNVDVHKDSGPLELVTTVLRSLPLQDTIAILIILMHIPSVSLTSIYALFAFITFVPPVAGGSAMNMNLWELWEAISSAPSLVTVALMDFAFFLFWAFLWPPLQDAILDMAKPIIALTLGGAGGGRSGSSSGFTACFGWVFFYHILRLTRSHWAPIVNQIPEPWRMPAIFRDPFDADYLYDKKSWIDLIKSGLAIHILMQGIVRGIKDWYLRRERATVAAGTTDPEAGKSASGTTDASTDPHPTSTENEAATISNSSTTLKKKRKQSAHVRQQQPLWAALASTKIVFMKEYEFSSKSVASAGSNATDIHNLGNAPFDRLPGQIWIAHIGSDEVSFSTSHFPDLDDEEEEDSTPSTPGTNGHALRPSAIPTHKPFYVRVNNAFWQPTRMVAVDDADDDAKDGTRWTGDIYGLRPASKYVCEFVDSRTHEILFATTVRTAQEALQETDSAGVLPNGQPYQRPDSPSTTLRNSIAVTEAKLIDEKARLKAARKEWKTRINALKKDNDATDNQLQSAGSQDEKLRGKIRQQENQKGFYEQETERIAEEIKNFDTAPELHERKKKMERAYLAEKKIFDAAQKDLKEHKARLDKDVCAKQVENTNLNTRRNKTATRIAKVESELHNITDANNRGINEAERKKQERAQREEYQSGIETYYRERLNMVRAENTQRADAVRATQTQVHNFHELLSSANGMSMDMVAGDGTHAPFAQVSQQLGNWQMNPAAQPHFPSGIFGASSTDLMSSGAPAWHSATLPPTAPAFEPRGFRSRGRSSSMLSDVSGFTQSSNEEDSPAVHAFPDSHPAWGRSRASGSADSGSSSQDGSGSGSALGSGNGTSGSGELTSPT